MQHLASPCEIHSGAFRGSTAARDRLGGHAIEHAAQFLRHRFVAMNLRPKISEPILVLMPAFTARPMAGRQHRRFVEKKELCLIPRDHNIPMTTMEIP